MIFARARDSLDLSQLLFDSSKNSVWWHERVASYRKVVYNFVKSSGFHNELAQYCDHYGIFILAGTRIRKQSQSKSSLPFSCIRPIKPCNKIQNCRANLISSPDCKTPVTNNLSTLQERQKTALLDKTARTEKFKIAKFF